MLCYHHDFYVNKNIFKILNSPYNDTETYFSIVNTQNSTVFSADTTIATSMCPQALANIFFIDTKLSE